MAFDCALKEKIREKYPYHIADKFRRLNTVDYKEKDEKRIDVISDTTEVIVHFLTLVALNDLIDKCLTKGVVVSNEYKVLFSKTFRKPAMGDWVGLLRETIKIFKKEQIPMFIEEMADYYIKGESSPSKAQQAFNSITTIRNKMAHPDRNYSRKELLDLCEEAENHLQVILEELGFIANYQLLHVSKVTVNYHRWAQPLYSIDIEDIKHEKPELLDSQPYEPERLIHSPTIIITKENKHEYLNLEPLILYSDEGEAGIQDVFMYFGWEKGKYIKFKPMDKGGVFNLYNSLYSKTIGNGILKFFEVFGTDKDVADFKESIH